MGDSRGILPQPQVQLCLATGLMVMIFDLSGPVVLHWAIQLWLDAMVRLFAGANGGLGLKIDLTPYLSGITNVP